MARKIRVHKVELPTQAASSEESVDTYENVYGREVGAYVVPTGDNHAVVVAGGSAADLGVVRLEYRLYDATYTLYATLGGYRAVANITEEHMRGALDRGELTQVILRSVITPLMREIEEGFLRKTSECAVRVRRS